MPLKVGVLGAGAVGAYVGGMIKLRTSADVVLVGRRNLVDQVTAGGMVLRPNPRKPRDVFAVHPTSLTVTDDPKALKGCDVIFVAVKTTATAEAASELERIAEKGGFPPHALVLSLQNGVGNGAILTKALEKHSVATLPCMVNFNVVWDSYGNLDSANGCVIRRCTPSKKGMPCLVVQDLPKKAAKDGTGMMDHPSVFSAKKANLAALIDAVAATGLVVKTELDISPTLFSKILVNLQSPINALSGAPVPVTLSKRKYRMAWRALLLEALDVYKACGIKTRKPYVSFLPLILASPDWLYNAAAPVLFPLDPKCKSSMLQDCESGRKTEIDAICGEVVRLARRNANRARDDDASGETWGMYGYGGALGRVLAILGLRSAGRSAGRSARLNARAVELVRRLEFNGLPDGRMAPDELWEALTNA